MTISGGLIFQVKVRAMLEGLRLAWDLGFKKVELECNNSLLVESILVGAAATSGMVELQMLHDMLVRPCVVHLRHIPLSQNAVADCLAKLVNSTMAQLTTMEVPSQSVRNLLLRDFHMLSLH